MERSKSNKTYADQEYENWRNNITEKHEKDLNKVDRKSFKIDLKSKILKEISNLKINDMQTNFKREVLKLKYKKDKWLEKQLNNRERVKKIESEKQKAIDRQLEINRIVQLQAQQISFE